MTELLSMRTSLEKRGNTRRRARRNRRGIVTNWKKGECPLFRGREELERAFDALDADDHGNSCDLALRDAAFEVEEAHRFAPFELPVDQRVDRPGLRIAGSAREAREKGVARGRPHDLGDVELVLERRFS